MDRRAVLAMAALAVAGCASAGHHPASASHPAVSSSTTATPAAASPSCHDRLLSWADGGGESDLKTISRDLGKAEIAGFSQNLGAVQAAATALGTDADNARGDLPPACVPGMRADYLTALNDFTAAADSANKGGTSDIAVSTNQIDAGGKAIQRATRDLKRWEREGEP